MSITAMRGLTPTTAAVENPRNFDESGWKIVDVSDTQRQEYVPIPDLQCADLATMPIILNYEQASAIEFIMNNRLSGPRGSMQQLPTD